MNKNILTIVGGVLAIAIVFTIVKTGVLTGDTGTASLTNNDSTMTTPEGLKIEDVVKGEGREVKTGDTISVNYLGTLTNGQKFDSSYDRGEPFSFTVGAGDVIKGWDMGLLGMQVGGKRMLTIPPSLAYQGTGHPILADATLVFEVELLSIGN